jgi:hypothetical protein
MTERSSEQERSLDQVAAESARLPDDVACGDCGPGTPERSARRSFLLGGAGLVGFAGTLASRPAFAGCNNLTMVYSPNHSNMQTVFCSNGKTPGFWMNHKTCWPTSIKPNDTFSKWFGTFTFSYSNETLAQALCAPNNDNLAFQIAGGLLNAASPYTNGQFGFGSAQNFANAVINAMKAKASEAPTYPSLQSMISQMNWDSSTNNISSWCGSATSVC